MRHPPVLLTLLAGIGMTLVACTPSPDAGGGTEPSDEPADANAAKVQGGGAADVPTISKRTYTAGSAQMKVSGFFEINADQDLNKVASLSDGEYTWLQYGDSGAQTANATITFGEGDSGVTVGVGPYSATGTSTDCSKKVDVTGTTISGHFSCAGVTGYNKDAGNMGTVNMEIDFAASS